MLSHKLTDDDIEEMRYLFTNEGWHVSELSKRYHVHSSIVSMYVKHLKRLVPARNQGTALKSYEDYVEDDEEIRAKKRMKCEHKHIAIICLKCGTHFEETKNQPAAAKIVFI